MRFSKHLAAVATATVLAGGLTAPAIAAAGARPSWRIQSTPSPRGLRLSTLTSGSCPSDSACITVGGEVGPRPLAPLAERWNGTKWAVQPMPRVNQGVLFAVSCLSAKICTAVGYSPKGTFAERWNGTKWVSQRTQNPPGAQDVVLNGVSCSSATSCTAVGSYGNDSRTLAEHWNGTKWAIQPTPNPAHRPNGSELRGVSCSSAAFCVAVGDSTGSDFRSHSLVERWNGTKWAIQVAPKPPGGNESKLTGVSCLSATACTAVGNSGSVNMTMTLAEHWNGSKWVVQPTPNPPGAQSSELDGVSCPATTVCTAVGHHLTLSDTDATLAERWNGTKWVLQSLPHPSGSASSALKGVSCSSAVVCTTVGAYIRKSGVEPTLAERYS